MMDQSNTEEEFTPEGGLLASELWADFYRAKKMSVIDFSDGYGVLQAVPMIESLTGKYLYTPRQSDTVDVESVNYPWIRVDVSDEKALAHLQVQYRVVRAPHDMQPAEHFIIDISADQEGLLAAMKSKTRYNIRLAQKKDVAIHYVTISDEDFDQVFDLFYTMVEETAHRKGVTFHPREHYRKMFDILPEENIALFAAEVSGGIFIAANIVTFYGNTATYLHGATADSHREFMAPFLLQWQAILCAKSRGLTRYDFGGVYSDTSDSGKTGITKFKKGFSPKTQILTMPGSYDVVRSVWKYYLYRILQKFKSFYK